jgi:hypothetical protein
MDDLVETFRLYMTEEMSLEFKRWHMFLAVAVALALSLST